MTKNLLLDANVLINIGYNKANSSALKEIISQYDFIYISSLSLFFAKLQSLQMENNKDYLKEIKIIQSVCTEIDFNSSIFAQADKILSGKDFEDACQVVTAIKYKCDILTSDEGLCDLYSSMIKIVFVPKR